MDRARWRITNNALFAINRAKGLADSGRISFGSLNYLPQHLTDAVFYFFN
jgi:hypothetical protein